jgi:hypothetical protein
MAGVQRHLFRWVSRSGDTFENLLPNAPLAPSCEPIVDGLVRAVILRAILPAAADFQNMHDPAQNASIILALGTRLVRRQMRNDLRPLLIVEPKQIRIHRLGPMTVDQAIESNEPCLGLDPRKYRQYVRSTQRPRAGHSVVDQRQAGGRDDFLGLSQ